jgi:hypothetical protein
MRCKVNTRTPKIIIPAQAGIQAYDSDLKLQDSLFHGIDKIGEATIFYRTIITGKNYKIRCREGQE